MIDSIAAFKAKAEFFPRGRIVPQRILKGPRKIKHLFKFGCDTWMIPTPAGYFGIMACGPDLPAIKVHDSSNLIGKKRRVFIQTSAYAPYQHLSLAGNKGITDEEWAVDANRLLLETLAKVGL